MHTNIFVNLLDT